MDFVLRRVRHRLDDSPLDDINPTGWEHAWTQELNELLTLLTRLVSLEPQQDDLLRSILAVPLLTVSELATAGVTWPAHDKDRKPRYSDGGLF